MKKTLFFILLYLMVGGIATSWAETKKAEKPAEITKKIPIDAVAVETSGKVRDYYREKKDFTLEFKQTYTSKITGRTLENSGVIFFKRPLNVRWEYRDKPKQHFITDGKSIWLAIPDKKTVQVHRNFSTSALESSISFLWGGSDLTHDYTVRSIATKKILGLERGTRVALELTPLTKDKPFEFMFLFVDPASGRIEETLLLDVMGNTNHFIFGEPKGEQTFEEGFFTFVPGPDWTVQEVKF